jgi:hypothetical protein
MRILQGSRPELDGVSGHASPFLAVLCFFGQGKKRQTSKADGIIINKGVVKKKWGYSLGPVRRLASIFSFFGGKKGFFFYKAFSLRGFFSMVIFLYGDFPLWAFSSEALSSVFFGAVFLRGIFSLALAASFLQIGGS